MSAAVRIELPFGRVLTVEPDKNVPGRVVVHLFSVGDKPMGFFEMDAKTGAQFVGALMDGIAATTVTQ